MDFEKLYKTYYMEVYSYVMTLMHSKTAAEEVTQEVFSRPLIPESHTGVNQVNLHGCAPLQKIPVPMYGKSNPGWHSFQTECPKMSGRQRPPKIMWSNPFWSRWIRCASIRYCIRWRSHIKKSSSFVYSGNCHLKISDRYSGKPKTGHASLITAPD